MPLDPLVFPGNQGLQDFGQGRIVGLPNPGGKQSGGGNMVVDRTQFFLNLDDQGVNLLPQHRIEGAGEDLHRVADPLGGNAQSMQGVGLTEIDRRGGKELIDQRS